MPNKSLSVQPEDLPLWDRGEQKAKAARQSMSGYVLSLIERDNHRGGSEGQIVDDVGLIVVRMHAPGRGAWRESFTGKWVTSADPAARDATFDQTGWCGVSASPRPAGRLPHGGRQHHRVRGLPPQVALPRSRFDEHAAQVRHRRRLREQHHRRRLSSGQGQGRRGKPATGVRPAPFLVVTGVDARPSAGDDQRAAPQAMKAVTARSATATAWRHRPADRCSPHSSPN